MGDCFILLSAGKSKRFKSKLKKQFITYKNKPLFEHSLKTALDSKLFKKILVVSNKKIKTKNNNKNTILTTKTNCKFCSFNSIKLLSINVKNVIKDSNTVRRNIIIINKFLFKNANINYEYI